MDSVVDRQLGDVEDVFQCADTEVTRMVLGQLDERDGQELGGGCPTGTLLQEKVTQSHIFEGVERVDIFVTMAITDSTDRVRRSIGRGVRDYGKILILAASTGRAMKARRRGPRRWMTAVCCSWGPRARVPPGATSAVHSLDIGVF